MAVQLIGTRTVTFGVDDRQDFPRIDIDSGETSLFYLDTDPSGIVLRKAYINVYAQLAGRRSPVSTPLLMKYFPTTEKVLLLLPIIQVRRRVQQRVTIYIQPKEFYPGSAGRENLKISLLYENALTAPFGVSLPSA